jgi:hypothetical protein
MNTPLFLAMALAVFAPAIACNGAEAVDVATKPASPWKSYPTRTLDDLPAIAAAPADAGLNRFGGRTDRPSRATGFFRTEQIDGRWWLIDPEGGRFIHRAVVSVSMQRAPGAVAALQRKFGGEEPWATQTAAWLHEQGFNGLGAWSDTTRLRAAPQKLAYTLIWNFMSSYGKKRGGTYQKPGHTGYPKDSIFVFDPEFEAFCQEHAQQLAATKDDPRLLGHFTDNELPLKREALANYLALPESDAGHRAATAWLRARHGAGATAKDITEQDQQDFLGVVAGRYFEIVARAIRRVDPNHLVLGPRLHGAALRFPEVFKAAGPHLDVVAINYYNAWTPVPERMDMWVKRKRAGRFSSPSGMRRAWTPGWRTRRARAGP